MTQISRMSNADEQLGTSCGSIPQSGLELTSLQWPERSCDRLGRLFYTLLSVTMFIAVLSNEV